MLRARFLACSNLKTAVAQLKPAFLLQLAIGGAGGVGMNAEPARELAGAGQALAGKHLAGENGEDNLGDQLLAERNFGVAIEPETHGGP